MTEILIKKLSKEVTLPKYETDGSSGLDLSACIDKNIEIKLIDAHWQFVKISRHD